MTASGTLPEGTMSYASSIATIATAEAVEFPDRYGYVSVANLGGNGAIYVTTNGTPANGDGSQDNVYAVAPGQTGVFANELPLWYQSSRVNAKGSDNVNFQSRAGQMPNPGTAVSLWADAANPYVVAAAG